MKKLKQTSDFSMITKESGEPSPVKGKKPAAKPKSRKGSAKPSAGKVANKGKKRGKNDMSDDEVLGSDDSLNDFIVGDDEDVVEVKKKRR